MKSFLRGIATSLAVALLIGGSLLAVGCDKSNPLLGTWQLDQKRNPPGAMMIMMFGGGQLEFGDAEAAIGGKPAAATYDVGDGHVDVTTDGETIRITILDDDHIQLRLGDSPHLVYRRAQPE